MAKYEARLTEPSKTNKNYIHYSNGGYNYCIERSGGSCLPNCVGYAWGRWREILGKMPNLSRANAENWYGYKADGYKRGQEPKLGAVICWRKGKAGVASDGAGHIAIVEQIKEDGTIITSNSDYSGRRFYLREFKPPYKLGSSYTFQGFIYLPVTFTDGATTNNSKEKDNTVSFDIGDKVKLTTDAKYYNGGNIPLWVRKSTLYVRQIDGDRVVISILKKGAVTGAVHKKYLVKK